MSPAKHALLWSRQNADAFNQPLSFNTSSVPNMQHLLSVRSASAHATHPPVGPTPRVTEATGLTASRLLALRIALMLCLPLDLAGRVSVQPAAELRHLQLH